KKPTIAATIATVDVVHFAQRGQSARGPRKSFMALGTEKGVYSSRSVISRAPRPCVAKLTDQRMKTRTRFWKPTRYQRWTKSHVIQARKPLRRSPLTSATAAARP